MSEPIMTEGAMITDSELREMLAEEMWKEGEPALSGAIRNGSDNSRGGNAALSAMRAVSQATAERCAKIAEGKTEHFKFQAGRIIGIEIAQAIRAQIPQESRRGEGATRAAVAQSGEASGLNPDLVSVRPGPAAPMNRVEILETLAKQVGKAIIEDDQVAKAYDTLNILGCVVALLKDAESKPHPTCDCLGVLVEAIREVAALQDIDVASNRNVLWRLADSLAARGK